MPATNFTPIQLYRSTTASQVPTSGNLSDGELAINTNDEKLYFKNSGGTVKLLASSAGASGDVVGPASATDNAVVRFDGTTGKLVQNSVVTIADSTGDVAGVGALTMGGTLTLNGGTANGVLYLNGSKVATSGSALTFDGTTATVNSGTNNTGLVVSASNSSSSQVNIGVGVLTAGRPFVGTNTNTNPLEIGTRAAADTVFVVNSTEQMRLTSTGLGIGTSSPAYKVDTTVNTNGINGYNAYGANGGASEQIGYRAINANSTGIFAGVNGFNYSGGFGSANQAVLTSIGNVALQLGTNSTVRATLDTSGNLGLGVTPSAWAGLTSYRSVELGTSAGTGVLGGPNDFQAFANAYYATGWKYAGTGAATSYKQGGGQHIWFTAPSGTAGNAITFSQVMTLDASGNLGIGTSSPSTKLQVNGNVYLGGAARNIYADNGSGIFFNGLNNFGSGIYSDGSGTALKFQTSSTDRMTLDSSGNLGLGVTPSAWSGLTRAFDLQYFGGVSSGDDGFRAYVAVTSNVYEAVAGTPRYKTSTATVPASMYRQRDGQHQWFYAPAGTAGNTISFTQALTLDASGNLLLGGTSAGASSAASLAIFNGTAPTGSVTNGIILYAEDVSSSSELKVRDEAGNVTTLSPHNFSLIPDGPSEDMAWAYYSEKGGKRINVDMLKLARMVEKLTGEKLVYES